jgi:DNA-binding response OmpR family regulator
MKPMKTRALSLYIVEDDEHFRETFIDVMALRGVDAAGAACGGDALGDLLTARPSVIVLDVQLPDMHGFELCRQIKRIAALAEVPVIMLSAATMYNDPRDRVEGMLAGASSFMTKPVTMDQLWSEIESLLG